MAATSTPLQGISQSLKPHIPITPPPDRLNFTMEAPENSTKPSSPSRAATATPAQTPPVKSEPQLTTPATPTKKPTQATPPPPPSFCPNLDISSSSSTATNTTTAVPALNNMDPRHLALVSRIAAYYQQRAQAVANYQHQKCQDWANMQRAKCQEMTQAAMLVVAWYVRDRIQRRRKREKQRFRRGLSERSTTKTTATTTTTAAAAAIATGVCKKKSAEASVHKWIGRVPRDVLLSPNTAAVDMPMDTDEVGFSMDAEPHPTDKEDELFAVADGMIRSRMARIEVPLMGALDFAADQDDSESESDFEEVRRWRPGGEDEEEMGGVAEYDDDDDDYLYEYDDDEDGEDLTEEVASKETINK